jgi:hypothetical protein
MTRAFLAFTFRLLFLMALGSLITPLNLSAATKRKLTPRRSAKLVSTSRHHVTRRLAGTKGSRIGRYHRSPSRSDYQRRMAKIHLEPQRVQEIQRALNQAGYLHREPNGLWDADTRLAMERYQQASGFAATGLPDARSLMKLGLGPHPLPPAADPSAAKTSADSTLANPAATSSAGQERPN